MMSRKDYVATAQILNNQLKINNCCDKFVAGFDELVEEFIAMFENDNKNFDATRFWDACFDGEDKK